MDSDNLSSIFAGAELCVLQAWHRAVDECAGREARHFPCGLVVPRRREGIVLPLRLAQVRLSRDQPLLSRGGDSLAPAATAPDHVPDRAWDLGRGSF